MTKHKGTKDVEVSDDQAVAQHNARNRPIAGEAGKPMDREEASHLWQAGSPAVNSDVDADNTVKTSILEKIDSPENLEAKEKAAEYAQSAAIQSFQYDDTDPTKLDVSDPRYVQPGSEKHKEHLAKKKAK